VTFSEAVRRGLACIRRPCYPEGVELELRHDPILHNERRSGLVVRLEHGEEVGSASFVTGKKLFLVGEVDRKELREATDFEGVGGVLAPGSSLFTIVPEGPSVA
jgi:hypothetical protein